MNKTIIHQMIQLEQLCYSKYITQDLLNDLISFYVKSIDCSGNQQSFPKIYFMEKLQSIVAKSESHIYVPKVESSIKQQEDKDTMNTCDVDSLNDFPDFLRRQSGSPTSSRKSSFKSQKGIVTEKERNLRIDAQFQLMTKQINIQQDLIKKTKKELEIKKKQVQDLQKSVSKIKQLYQNKQAQNRLKKRNRKFSEQLLLKQLQKANNIQDQNEVLNELKQYKKEIDFIFENSGLYKPFRAKFLSQNNQDQMDNIFQTKNQNQIKKGSLVQLERCKSLPKCSPKQILTINIPMSFISQNSKENSYDQNHDQQYTPKFNRQSPTIHKSTRQQSGQKEDVQHQKYVSQIHEDSDEISEDNYF